MLRRHLTAAAAVAAAVALVAGCAERRPPEQQAVEAMVLETCAPADDVRAHPVCECAFDRLVDELGLEGLEELDRRLRDEPELPERVQQVILDCTFDQVDPTPPTTVPRPTTTTERRPTTSAAERSTTTERRTTTTGEDTTSDEP